MKNTFDINFYKLVLEEINQELNEYCKRFYVINNTDSVEVRRCKKAINDLMSLQDKFENDESTYKQAEELIGFWLKKMKEEQKQQTVNESAEEVEVTIYGNVKKFKNAKECEKYFDKLLDTCDPDSSEADRYYYIFGCLDAGKTKINADDQNDYSESELIAWFESISK